MNLATNMPMNYILNNYLFTFSYFYNAIYLDFAKPSIFVQVERYIEYNDVQI